MRNTNDGGQAFPRAYADMGENSPVGPDGMTLLDWFAGQAIVGLALSDADEEATAVWAYQLAYAMLEVRGK